MPFDGEVQSEFYHIIIGEAGQAAILQYLYLKSRLDHFWFGNRHVSTCSSQVPNMCFHTLSMELQSAVLMCSDTLLGVYF